MPIYEYECGSCGVRFERRQGFADAPLTGCPECEGTVRRVFQPVGIVFKGSGWYITDSKRNNNQSSSTSSSKEDKSEGKTESKTEAKASGSDD